VDARANGNSNAHAHGHSHPDRHFDANRDSATGHVYTDGHIHRYGHSDLDGYVNPDRDADGWIGGRLVRLDHL
jgi:hypothetical protein